MHDFYSIVLKNDYFTKIEFHGSDTARVYINKYSLKMSHFAKLYEKEPPLLTNTEINNIVKTIA